MEVVSLHPDRTQPTSPRFSQRRCRSGSFDLDSATSGADPVVPASNRPPPSPIRPPTTCGQREAVSASSPAARGRLSSPAAALSSPSRASSDRSLVCVGSRLLRDMRPRKWAETGQVVANLILQKQFSLTWASALVVLPSGLWAAAVEPRQLAP
jgi:hypothetical protein